MDNKFKIQVPDGDKNECKKNNKTHAKKVHLQKHKLHSSIKSFKCKSCKEIFTSKQACTFKLNQNLKTHLVVNTGERPHKCEICNKKFTQKSGLLTHEKIHALVNRYECHNCIISKFTQKEYSRKYLKLHKTESFQQCKSIQEKLKSFKKESKNPKVETQRPTINTTESVGRVEAAEIVNDLSLSNSGVVDEINVNYQKYQPASVVEPSINIFPFLNFNMPEPSSSSTIIQSTGNNEKGSKNLYTKAGEIEIIDILDEDDEDVVKIEEINRNTPEIFIIKDVQKKKVDNRNNKANVNVDETIEDQLKGLVTNIKNNIKSLINSMK